jgi:hypothetical protein
MTGRLVFQLKAKGEEKGEDTCQERLPIAKQLKIGRFVLKIDGDGPVFSGLAGAVAHESSSGQMVGVADDPTWGNPCPIARGWERSRGVTTKLGGMWHFHHERNHQGKGNVLLFPTVSQDAECEGPMQCRERLGGLLKYYTCEAA